MPPPPSLLPPPTSKTITYLDLLLEHPLHRVVDRHVVRFGLALHTPGGSPRPQVPSHPTSPPHIRGPTDGADRCVQRDKQTKKTPKGHGGCGSFPTYGRHRQYINTTTSDGGINREGRRETRSRPGPTPRTWASVCRPPQPSTRAAPQEPKKDAPSGETPRGDGFRAACVPAEWR